MLKDLDFIEGTTLNGQELPPTFLKIGMKKRAVLGQLEVDVKYLERLAIMDYSLLVGVHYKDRDARERAEEAAARTVDERKGKSRRVRERQSNYGIRKDEVVIPRGVIREVQRKMQRSAETGDRDAKDKDRDKQQQQQQPGSR